MLFYAITFIVFFLSVFSISFYLLRHKNLVKDNLHIIIPAICIGLWAISVLINTNFNQPKSDFVAFYYSLSDTLSFTKGIVIFVSFFNIFNKKITYSQFFLNKMVFL